MTDTVYVLFVVVDMVYFLIVDGRYSTFVHQKEVRSWIVPFSVALTRAVCAPTREFG